MFGVFNRPGNATGEDRSQYDQCDGFGLHSSISFEQLFGDRSCCVATSRLALRRVGFHGVRVHIPPGLRKERMRRAVDSSGVSASRVRGGTGGSRQAGRRGPQVGQAPGPVRCGRGWVRGSGAPCGVSPRILTIIQSSSASASNRPLIRPAAGACDPPPALPHRCPAPIPAGLPGLVRHCSQGHL